MDTQAYISTLLALLEDGATQVSLPVSGTSMGPFLHPGDTVILSAPEGKQKPGQVILYTRPDGRYILHRIMAVRSDGLCLVQGDNQLHPEPVAPHQIRAIATGAIRKGKHCRAGSILWWFYAHPWRLLAPLRPWFARIKQR